MTGRVYLGHVYSGLTTSPLEALALEYAENVRVFLDMPRDMRCSRMWYV